MRKTLSVLLKAALLTITVLAVRVEFFAGGYFNWWILYLFTTQSNILVFFVTLWLLLTRERRHGSSCTILTGAALLAITLTGIVYTMVIYPIWQHGGLLGTGVYSWSRIATHIVVPVGFIVNWIFFEAHGSCKWLHLPMWVLYPAAYGLIMLHRGLIMYEFMHRVSGLLLVFALFLLIGGLYIGLDRIWGRAHAGPPARRSTRKRRRYG